MTGLDPFSPDIVTAAEEIVEVGQVTCTDEEKTELVKQIAAIDELIAQCEEELKKILEKNIKALVEAKASVTAVAGTTTTEEAITTEKIADRADEATIKVELSCADFIELVKTCKSQSTYKFSYLNDQI